MFFKTLTELITELEESLVVVSATSIFPALKRKQAIAHACRAASRFHRLAMVYEGLDFATAQVDYTLPDYIRPEWIRDVQQKVWSDPYGSNGVDLPEVYDGVPWWRVDRADDGTPTLRIDTWVGNTDTRILYDIPLPVPPAMASNDTVHTSAMTISQTTIPFTTAANAAKYPWPGWVKIDNEIIFYAEVDYASGLKTATRGVAPSVAATHASTASIEPVIPAEKAELYEWLLLAASAWLHGVAINDVAVGDRSDHNFGARWWQQQADALRPAAATAARRGRFLLGQEGRL